MYRTTTRAIVTVEPSLSMRNGAEESRFLSYTIEISTGEEVAAQVGTGRSPMATAASRKCAAPGSSASSRC
jgi:hypothetical protein